MEKLLDYTSDSDSDPELPNFPPSTSLPPLPDAITQRYNHTPPTRQEMVLRYNRLTSIPPGWLNSYTSAELTPTLRHCNLLNGLVRNVNMVFKYATKCKPPDIQGLHENKLGIVMPLHISLSNNFYLTREKKDAFKRKLDEEIPKLKWDMQRTLLTFDKIRAVPNNNATNIFVALSLDSASKKRIKPLFKLVHGVIDELRGDEEMVYSGPEIVDPEQLHVSFGTCEHDFPFKLGDLEELDELCENIDIGDEITLNYDSVMVVEQGGGRFVINLY